MTEQSPNTPKRRKKKPRIDFDDHPYRRRKISKSDNSSSDEPFLDSYSYRRAARPKRHKVMDPLYMAGFIDDDTKPYEIEKRFALLEQATKNGMSEEEAARKVYMENAKPTEIIDVDSWLNSNLDFEDQDSLEDSNWDQWSPDEDPEERLPDDGSIVRTREKKKKKKPTNISSISENFGLEKLGAHIERWPVRRFEKFRPMSGEGIIEIAAPDKMRNSITISPTEFKLMTDPAHFFKLDYFDPDLVRSIIGNYIGKVDGYVMDPPLNDPTYTKEMFYNFIEVLIPTGPNPYFAIWVDPDTYGDVCLVMGEHGMEMCDSVMVELCDSMLEPVEFVTKEGFPQHTRMIVLYRLGMTKITDITQQKLRDIGWGIVYPNGKSRGRYGMPLLANEILETLFQHNKAKKNFVEIWPSRYSIKENWYNFDEAL